MNFDKVISWIISVIDRYGLFGVFVGSFVEELVAPIPSPLIMMSAGFVFLGKGSTSVDLILNMFVIALVGGVGATLGSYFIYGLAFCGGKTLVDKILRFVGVSWNDVEKIREKLNGSKKSELAIIALRSIPIMPSAAIAISCGVIRMNPISYGLSFFVGGVVRNIVFLIVGWQMGSAYLQGAQSIENLTDLVTKLIAVILVVALGFMYWKKVKSQR